MIPFVIVTVLTCSDADALISKMKTYKVSEEQRAEFIQVVKDGTSECDWDAKAD